jgi:hypothetical protein
MLSRASLRSLVTYLVLACYMGAYSCLKDAVMGLHAKPALSMLPSSRLHEASIVKIVLQQDARSDPVICHDRFVAIFSSSAHALHVPALQTALSKVTSRWGGRYLSCRSVSDHYREGVWHKMDHVGRERGNIIGQHHSSRHGCDKDSCLRANKVNGCRVLYLSREVLGSHSIGKFAHPNIMQFAK